MLKIRYLLTYFDDMLSGRLYTVPGRDKRTVIETHTAANTALVHSIARLNKKPRCR